MSSTQGSSALLDPLMHCPTISGFGLPYLPNPGAPTWNPDGTEIAFYGKREPARGLWLTTDRGQVRRVPLGIASTTQEMWSLTERLHVDRPQWSPDGERLLVAGLAHGATESSLFIVSSTDGRIIVDTSELPGHHRGGRWSPDGSSLAYTEWRDGKHDLWLLDIGSSRPYQLIFDRFDNRDPQWHPSGQQIAYTTQRNDEDRLVTWVAVLDLTTGDSRIVSPVGSTHSRYPRWSADGSRLYFLSDVGNWDAVWWVDAGGIPLRATPQVESEVVHFDVSARNDELVVTLSERTDHRLYICRSGHFTALTRGPGTAWWPAFDPAGERVAFVKQGPFEPPALHCIGVLDGTTRFVVDWVPPRSEVGRVEQVSLEAPDGVAIDAIAFRPPGPPRGGILYVHGGPNAQFTHGWYPFLHELALQGFAVIAPNFRGSNGYGRQFMDSNRHDWGGAVVGDWLAAVDWMVTEAGVPPGRVGVYGRSYGGYAAMLLIGKEPNIFKAAVCHAGVYDFAEFFQVTFVRALAYRSMGLPYLNREICERQSPTTYYRDIRGPILITQGELDLGTPSRDAERTVARLSALGKQVEYAFYPGEAHDIVQPDHIRDATGRIVKFFVDHLQQADSTHGTL